MNLNGGERPGEREILTGEEKRERFRRMQYDYTDDASAERIWKVLEGRRKQCR